MPSFLIMHHVSDHPVLLLLLLLQPASAAEVHTEQPQSASHAAGCNRRYHSHWQCVGCFLVTVLSSSNVYVNEIGGRRRGMAHGAISSLHLGALSFDIPVA